MNQLPLFPLKLVLLPKEKISLHIFEDRYKKMISQCIKQQSMFGIVLSLNDKMEKIGCSVKIINIVKEFDSGEFDITAEGVARFRVEDVIKEKSLNIGLIEYIPDETLCHDYNLLNSVQDKYIKILLSHQINMDLDIEMNKSSAFELTERILLPVNVKQLILEVDDETERLCILNDVFDKLLRRKQKNQDFERPDTLNIN